VAGERVEQLGQRGAVHELHREPGDAPLLAPREHRYDARVTQPRHSRDLAPEAFARPAEVQQLRPDELERDLPLQRGLLGAEHHAHAAAAEARQQAELPEALREAVVPALGRMAVEEAPSDQADVAEPADHRAQRRGLLRALAAERIERRGPVLLHAREALHHEVAQRAARSVCGARAARGVCGARAARGVGAARAAGPVLARHAGVSSSARRGAKGAHSR
jgi:hypothetical protein